MLKLSAHALLIYFSLFADDFMEHVEDSEEETGTGDYEQLAVAMAADGPPASSESEQEEGSTASEEEDEEDDEDRPGKQIDGETTSHLLFVDKILILCSWRNGRRNNTQTR